MGAGHVQTGLNLNIFAQAENQDQKYYLKLLTDKIFPNKKDVRLKKICDKQYKWIVDSKGSEIDDVVFTNFISKAKWLFFCNGKFIENLYNVPHDSLVVVGSHGHGIIKDLLFGSKMEIVQ